MKKPTSNYLASRQRQRPESTGTQATSTPVAHAYGSPGISPSPSPQPPAPPRRGLTLVELLIVIVILGILVAAVLPLLAPRTGERRIREASRGLNTFISLAMAKAAGEGRPFGVGFKKLSQDTGAANDRPVCLEVFLAEQPQPYVGFSDSSMVRVASNFRNANRSFVGDYPPSTVGPTIVLEFVVRSKSDEQDLLPADLDSDIFPSGMIRPGDVLQVNGAQYEILPPSRNFMSSMSITLDPATGFFTFQESSNANQASKPTLVAKPIDTTGQVFVPTHDATGLPLSLNANGVLVTPRTPPAVTFPIWSNPRPYRIIRQPQPTSASPYQLPEGVAIDLQGSGLHGDAPLVVENNGVDPSSPVGTRNNDDPIYVMFTPAGSISEVRYNRGGDGTSSGAKDFVTIRPSTNLSLLVGARENLPVDTNLNATGVTAENDLEELKARVNWTNLDSLWVNIGGQSGSISTTENAFVDVVQSEQDSINQNIDYDKNGGVDALDIRREQIRRARAFAREMNRDGGN